jgi:hypothetical protein
VTPKVLLTTIHYMKVTHQSLYVWICCYESIPVRFYTKCCINSLVITSDGYRDAFSEKPVADASAP